MIPSAFLWTTVIGWLLLISKGTDVVFVSEEDRPAYELYNEAVNLARVGDDIGAIHAYRASLELKYDIPEVHQNLALLLDQRGEVDSALYHHVMSVQFATSDIFKSTVLVNLAGAQMRNSGPDLESAISLLLASIELNPHNDDAYVTLSAIYTGMKQYDRANVYLDLGLSVNPSNPIGLIYKGNHYFRIKEYNTAVQWYQRALIESESRDMPSKDKVLLFNNMGQCYREGGACEAAIAVFWAARNHCRDDSIMVLWTLSNMLAVQGICSNWNNLEVMEDEMIKVLDVSSFGETNLLRTSNEKEIHKVPMKKDQVVDLYTFMLQRFVSSKSDLALASSPALGCVGTVQRRTSPAITHSRPVRVGYFSFDWRDHPMGRLTSALVSTHDPERFFIACFYFGDPDESWYSQPRVHKASKSRNLTYRAYSQSPQLFARERCTVFVDLTVVRDNNIKQSAPLPDSDMLALLESYELDILVDLTAHTTGGRIDVSAMLLQPLKINYLGYPGTTGCDGFDYNMVDPIIAPPDILGRSFSENLIYLPGTYQANDLPNSVLPCSCNNSDPSCCRKEALKAVRESLNGSAALLGETLYNYSLSNISSIWMCAFNANKKMEPISFGGMILVLYLPYIINRPPSD